MRCRNTRISVCCSKEAFEKWSYRHPGQTLFSFLTTLSRVPAGIRFGLLGLGLEKACCPLPAGVIVMLAAEAGVFENQLPRWLGQVSCFPCVFPISLHFSRLLRTEPPPEQKEANRRRGNLRLVGEFVC